MKKRSKLDLSAGQVQEKRQAPGFSRVPGDQRGPNPQPRYTGTTAATSLHKSRKVVAVEPRHLPRAVIVKTVAAVAIAALSLYLLKRRLF